jgi:hypothetical protein
MAGFGEQVIERGSDKPVSVECPWEEYQKKKDGAGGSILVVDVNGIPNDGGYPARFSA